MKDLMKHCKDSKTGDIYAYAADGSDDGYIKKGLVLLSDEELTLFRASQQVTEEVPDRVTMRQARLALFSAGKLQSIEDAINLMEEPSSTTIRIEWDYAHEVFRNSCFVSLLSHAINLDDKTLDDLFLTASTL